MLRVIKHIEHLGSAFPQFGHTLVCEGIQLYFKAVEKRHIH